MVVYRTFTSISVVACGLLALSATPSSISTDVALLILGGLLAPAIVLALRARFGRGIVASMPAARQLALADARDVMRMDSDKG